MSGVAFGPAPPETVLAKLQALQAKKDAGLLAIAGVFATIAAKHLNGTKWTSVYELPRFAELWPKERYNVKTARRLQTGINWCRGYDASGNRQLKPTPDEVEERWLQFAAEAKGESGGEEWSTGGLTTALTRLRNKDKEAQMEQRLVASGRVVAVDHLAALEDKRAQDAAELKAQLEQQQRDHVLFQHQVASQQKVLNANQVKLESRSRTLSRKIEHLSAKKASARQYGNEVDSDEDDEASQPQLSWRASRADPPSPSPTPSSSRRRRRPARAPVLERDHHDADAEASTSSRRSHSQQVLERKPSTSARPSSSSHRRLASDEPTSTASGSTASGSTQRALTRRRTPFPRASGSSTAEYGIDDVFDDVRIKPKHAAVAREGDHLKVGAAKLDEADAEAAAEAGELHRAPPTLERVTRNGTAGSSRSSRLNAAAVDDEHEGSPLEHDEPEMAFDGRDSPRGSSKSTAEVQIAPSCTVRRYWPTRSIVEDAAERGDPPTPSASASRDAPARGALERRTTQAPTAERGAPQSGRREAGASELGEEVASQRGVPEEAPEVERLRAKLAAVGHGRDDGDDSPGRAAASGSNSPASRSPSPPACPNVTPRSKSRRRRLSMYGEAAFAALTGALGPVPRAQS